MATPEAPADPAPLVSRPKQARSRRTLEKMLAAGRAILAAEGPAGVTVAAVTKRARVSVGSFYARFPGKEDFLRHLGEEALEEARSEWSSARAARDGELRSPYAPALRDRVEWVVGTLDRLLREGSGAVILRLDGVDDPGPTRVSRLEAFLAGELEAALGAPPAKALVAARVALALLRPPPANETAPPPEGDGAARELTDLLTAYLTPGLPREATEAEPDPFDVWG